MFIPHVAAAFLSFATLFSPLSSAHTWVEQYQVIGPNGSYIGDSGYSRGYVARTDSTFEGDANILWMLPELSAREPNGDVRNRINSSDPLCHPNQRTSNYTNPEYPMLKVSPGSYVAMKYYENGHVTLPWNQPGKPQMGGTVFVFGTTNPTNDETIANVMKWTPDGKGGDARGFLMTAQNFDDGRCHQINNCLLSAERQVLYPNYVSDTNTSAELWCETDLKIPSDQTPGSTLTTYWVWQWPTEAGTQCVYPDGKDEYYTTCADFDIIADSTNDVKIADEVDANTLLQQDFATVAVPTYASRTALTTSPSVSLDDWASYSAQLTQSIPLPASFTSACAISAQEAAAAVSAGQTPALPPSCPAGKWATGALFDAISASVARFAQTPSITAPVVPDSTSTSVPSSTAASVSASQAASASAPSSALVTATTFVPGSPASATTVMSVTTVTAWATVTVISQADVGSTNALSVGTNGVVDMAAASSMSQPFARRNHARYFGMRAT